ncbi:hypothetical protein ACFPOE_11515 [Caenimonas terrae]|uniref:Uncharacterized protein n=1 Tax=Caenimonas terrae TaxID=696074 RepID=A0ABW0NCA3_9BURK
MKARCASCGCQLTVDELTHYGHSCESCEGKAYDGERAPPRRLLPRDRIVEALGAFFGLLGTVLLATKVDGAGWGFVAFLASNIGWLAFSWKRGHWYMFAQQVGFTVTSLLGIWNWLLQPMLGAST